MNLFDLAPWPWNWVARAASVAAVAVACWWGWDHYIADPYIAEGVAREHVRTAAAEGANRTLAAERDSLKQQVQDLQQAAKAEATRVAADKKRIEEQNAAKLAMLLDNTKRLAAIANGPPAPTAEEACHEADALLDEYAARRLRDH